VTPYALLLVKPVDNDLVIRQRYHVLINTEHPDRNHGVPGTMWFVLKAAYEAIKTEPRRAEWLRRQQLLAGVCPMCRGSGVTWRRLGPDRAVRACDGCGGGGKLTD
jgi:DnaJ-class molecular chaperone